MEASNPGPMATSSRPGGSAEHVFTSSASQVRLPSLRDSSESVFQQNNDAGRSFSAAETTRHRLSSICVEVRLPNEVGGNFGKAEGWKDHPEVGGLAWRKGLLITMWKAPGRGPRGL